MESQASGGGGTPPAEHFRCILRAKSSGPVMGRPHRERQPLKQRSRFPTFPFDKVASARLPSTRPCRLRNPRRLCQGFVLTPDAMDGARPTPGSLSRTILVRLPSPTPPMSDEKKSGYSLPALLIAGLTVGGARCSVCRKPGRMPLHFRGPPNPRRKAQESPKAAATRGPPGRSSC